MRAILFLVVVPGAATADALCEQWWYTRNLLFDRAGYCFSSPLGQALFDNSDCTTTQPVLSKEARALVADIRFMESEFECAVDSSATALTMFDPATMTGWTLDVPVPTEYGGGCNGYRGEPFELHARRDASAPVSGRVPAGSDIYFAHMNVGDWIYVTGRGIEGEGWAPLSIVDDLDCEVYPG